MLDIPYAAQQQGDVTANDLRLTERARALRPRVLWWWGERRIGKAHGAYCYICDGFAVTWDTRYPITEAAIAAILDHRGRHFSGPYLLTAVRAAGMSPAAEASPATGGKAP